MVREFGYEYDAALNEKVWGETKGQVTSKKLYGAYCLRSGRDALKAIAREYEPSIVLLPALSCNSMALPFERYGHTVKYYKLKPDYTIDLNSLDIGRERTLFLYMDYFGRNAIKDDELSNLRKNNGNTVFIEDRTHNLIWKRQFSFKPDYIIASLRKWLPIPDGGLLWGTITKTLGTDTSFSAMRLKAQCMRYDFLRCGDESIKAEYRKIFSAVSDVLNNDEPSAMSAYSFTLAKETDMGSLQTVRKLNSQILISVLRESNHITLIQSTPGFSDLYVPFIVPNRDEVQKRLSALGIFNTIIWPLTDTQKETCGVTRFTEENMLAAPCDQRYTQEDMVYIGREIVRVVEDVKR